MKKFIIFLFVLIAYIPAFADEYIFPVPMGKINVINGYERDEKETTHKGEKSKFSLDFQFIDDTGRLTTDDFGSQCYTIGMPILAAKDGKVVDIRRPKSDKELNEGYGYVVRVEYPDGSYTWYAHMIEETFAVGKGDYVKKGQILGLMGSTGYSRGKTCMWENTINAQVKNIAPHLHFETNKSDTSAVLQEPLIGKEYYRDIVKGVYESITLMIDPKNHWGEYESKVPYKLTYMPSAVSSFSPLTVQAGSEQVFTIKGENLFESLTIHTLPCQDSVKWIKKEGDEQQFSCTVNDRIGSQSGFIRFSTNRSPDFHFSINVVKEEKAPQITGVDINGGQTVFPQKETEFIVKGENLPGDLKLADELCSDYIYEKAYPDEVKFKCKVTGTVLDQKGRRINKLHTLETNLISESTNYTYSFSFDVDFKVKVEKVNPEYAIAGEKTNIKFTGKNMNVIGAFWIDNCQNLREVSRSDTELEVQCIPDYPDKTWNIFVPDYLKRAEYKLLLKDYPNGNLLHEGELNILYDNLVKVVNTEPVDPILEEKTKFVINGFNMPEQVFVKMEGCEDIQVQPEKDNQVIFTCTPTYLGGEQARDTILNQEKLVDEAGFFTSWYKTSKWEKIMEEQKRTLYVGLSRNFGTMSKNSVIYQGEVFPMTQKYKEYSQKDRGGEVSEDVEEEPGEETGVIPEELKKVDVDFDFPKCELKPEREVGVKFAYDLSRYTLDRSDYIREVQYDGEIIKDAVYVELEGEHIKYTKQVDSVTHTFYDHKDFGYLKKFVMLGDNYLYLTEDNHVFCNGIDLGKGGGIISKDGNLAYVLISPDEKYYLIYNNEIIDQIENRLYYIKYSCINCALDFLSIEGDHLAYVDLNGHVIYDGEDMGEGDRPVIKNGHLYFDRKFENNTHLIVDGKDLGSYSDNIYRILGEDVVFKRDHSLYWNGDWVTDNVISFTTKESNGHVAFITEEYDPSTKERTSNYYYDGEKLDGVSRDFDISLDSYAYTGDNNPGKLSHLIINGEDKGRGSFLYFLNNGNSVYRLANKEDPHGGYVPYSSDYYDGRKLDNKEENFQSCKDHLAYIYKYDNIGVYDDNELGPNVSIITLIEDELFFTKYEEKQGYLYHNDKLIGEADHNYKIYVNREVENCRIID